MLVQQHDAVPQEAEIVCPARKIDASVRIVAAWPMRSRWSIQGRIELACLGGAAAGHDLEEEPPE
jgi:hypothetical protein